MPANPLDLRLAQLLVSRGVLTRAQGREALAAAARHPQQRGGSALGHLLAVRGVLSPADCDRWLQITLSASAEIRGVDLAASSEATFAPGVTPPGPHGEATHLPGAPPAALPGDATFAPGLTPTGRAGLAPSGEPAADVTFVPGGVTPPHESAFPHAGDMTLIPDDEAATRADLAGSSPELDASSAPTVGPPRRPTGHLVAMADGDQTFAQLDLGPVPAAAPVPHDPDATLLQPGDYASRGSDSGPVASDNATLMAIPEALSSAYGRGPNDTELQATNADVPRGRPRAALAPVLVDLFHDQRYRLTSVVDPNRAEATDLRLRAPVVVRKPGQALSPEGCEQFLREAYVLAQLDHPAIPRVHDAGVENGEPFFTLEPLEGKPLGRGKHSLQELLRAFLSVSGAIEHAHTRGVVHGSLRPAVVRLGTFGRVWVTDWGTAMPLAGASPEVQQALRVAPSEAPTPQAPELGRGRPPSERTDVWGLGKVLQGILRAVEHDPATRPLKAVATKALEPVASRRYRSAQALGHEVQRFLDGERVLADHESLLASARRLARNHPAQASAFAVGLLAVLALAVFTSLAVHGSWSVAVAAMAETKEQQQASAARLVEARAAAKQAAAEQRRAAQQLGFSQALDTALRAASASIAAGLDPASEGGREHNRAQNSLVLDAFRVAERKARELDDPDAMRRLLAARGEWALRRSLAPPELRQALDDYRAWSKLDPTSEAAQLGRFVAARNLSTQDDAIEEERALVALSKLKGVWGRVAKVALHVREAERARDAGDQGVAQERGLTALEEIATLVGEAPQLQTASFVYELEGRAYQAQSGLNTRGTDKGLREFDLAAHLDPRSPAPAQLLLRFWNLRYGLHLSWALVSRAWCGKLLAASDYSERPEPLVELAAYLQLMQRSAASLSLLERAFARRLPDGRQSDEFWRLAELLRVRAQLAGGMPLDSFEPDFDALPVTHRAQAAFLKAHTFLIEGDAESFDRLVHQGTRDLRAAGREIGQSYGDLFNALSDTRGPNLLPVLSRSVPSIQEVQNLPPAPELVAMIAARLRWLTYNRGAPPPLVNAHFAWLDRRLTALPQGARDRLQGIFLASQARWLLSQGRADPGPTHVALLDAWALINIGNDFRGAAPVLRELLVDRLRRIGRPQLAQGLEDDDPVRELWVRRWWVPRELYAEDTWRSR